MSRPTPPMADESAISESYERFRPVLYCAANPIRLQIMDFLHTAGEPQRVTEIVAVCGLPQPIVSQQLKFMKDKGVVSGERRANCIYYTLVSREAIYLLECVYRWPEQQLAALWKRRATRSEREKAGRSEHHRQC